MITARGYVSAARAGAKPSSSDPPPNDPRRGVASMDPELPQVRSPMRGFPMDVTLAVGLGIALLLIGWKWWAAVLAAVLLFAILRWFRK